MAKVQEEIKAKIKKVKGRIKLLQSMPYKGCYIYVRMVDTDIFLYDVCFNNQIYSDYIIIKPEKGKKKLSEKEIRGAGGFLFAAACTTVDELMKLIQKDRLSNPIKSEKIKKSVN